MKHITLFGIDKQYKRLKSKINKSVIKSLTTYDYINGTNVYALESLLESYTSSTYCTTCASGTDALRQCPWIRKTFPALAGGIGDNNA